MSIKKVSTFKERFAQLCSENPSSDSRLADSLHVSKQTISAWKSGLRSPKDLTVIMIASFFNVNAQWLMGFDVPREQGASVVSGTDRSPSDLTPHVHTDDKLTVADVFKIKDTMPTGKIFGAQASVSNQKMSPEKAVSLFRAIGKFATKNPQSAGELLAELYENDVF